MNKSIKTLFLGFALIVGFGQAVEWYEEGDGGYTWINESGVAPSNYGDFQFTGSATSMVVDAGALIGDEGDFLGAFYDGELRGIAYAFPNNLPPSPYFGESIYYLYMYSNVSGSETMDFKFYDASSGTVSDLPETMTFVSDMALGTLFSPEEFSVTLSENPPEPDPPGCYVDDSGWNVEGEGGYTYSNGNIVPWNSNMFLNTNSVTYAVQNSNSEIIGDDGDLLGIFYEGELRGITDVYPVPFGPYEGNNFFLLYMYSNDTGTEEFNLKFYDESSGLTCNIEETYLFIATKLIFAEFKISSIPIRIATAFFLVITL